MTETPTPKEALKALAADLEELGVDVIDVVADPEPQRIRVIAEADTTDERDEAIRGVMLAYQHAVHDFGDESKGGVELMAEVLAAHAVDESLQDARAWRSIYRNDNKLSELFEDFTAEGDGQSQQEKLNALQNLTSDNTSTS